MNSLNKLPMSTTSFYVTSPTQITSPLHKPLHMKRPSQSQMKELKELEYENRNFFHMIGVHNDTNITAKSLKKDQKFLRLSSNDIDDAQIKMSELILQTQNLLK